MGYVARDIGNGVCAEHITWSVMLQPCQHSAVVDVQLFLTS